MVWNSGEATISYTTREITGLARSAPAWTYVGPLADPPPDPERSAARPRVYVSFGTYFNVDLPPVRAAAEAFEQLDVDALLSTERAAMTPADLEPHPSNVEVHEFVDGREQLARADAFVTHAGASSVHESLLAGVPMVCLPQGADQFDWARRVAELGAGVVAEPEPASIATAVRQVLEDRRYGARAGELGRHLRDFDGAHHVLQRVDSTLARAA